MIFILILLKLYAIILWIFLKTRRTDMTEEFDNAIDEIVPDDKKIDKKKNKKNKKASEKPTRPSGEIFDIAEIFILCTAFIVLFFSVFIRMTVVEGDSMTDTLHDGEYLLIQDLFYTPQRGDIVVVNDLTKEKVGKMYTKPLVKRVIAIGGDEIEIKDGVVRVNGETLVESYIREAMKPTDNISLKLGENEVFVMGDNRNHSGDSRLIGPIDVRCIVGKAIIRVFPFDKFAVLTHADS